MIFKSTFLKKIDDDKVFNSTFPGPDDYDDLIESDTDGYGKKGEVLFKFRKSIIPNSINNNFHKLADICMRTTSIRRDASGHQEFEESRVIGYDLNRRSNGYIAETHFTRTQHKEYKKVVKLIEFVNGVYRKEFPAHYYKQEKLNIDPHYLIGNTVFTQCIFNKSFRTCIHRDKSNFTNTMSNMICLGDSSFSGGYLVLPQYRVAINMRPGDYLGFMGKEIWHGNTKITGPGTRLTIVCYAKKEMEGSNYEEEQFKMARKLTDQQ